MNLTNEQFSHIFSGVYNSSFPIFNSINKISSIWENFIWSKRIKRIEI